MRDANNLETMDGLEYLASAPKGEVFTGMVAVDNELFLATDKHLYVLKNKKRLEKVE